MAGFSELIKNFDKTRDYIRDFFIYGCKIRSEFNGKSIRTYGDEKRRVESWMGDYMRYDDSVHGRSVSISVDSGRIPENPLYNAYYSKSFTDKDIVLHFLITDILADAKSLPLRDIVDELNSAYEKLFDEQTVRNKLKEYVAEGLIISEKQGKTLYYSLSDDRADEYMRDLKGLDDAVKFYSETQHFGIIGNSILKMLDMKNDLFFIKHNYMIHTLEDILIPEILPAINEKRYIAFRTFSAKSQKVKEAQAVPLQILISAQTGRRYLAVYIPALKRFTSLRLDYIKTVKKGDPCESYDEINKKYDANIKKCFGVSFGTRRETGTVTPMKITFFVDEEKEPYIIDRLDREKRCCTLEKSGEHLYTLTADVFDPNEIMHWVKTFIGRIVNIEGGSEPVIERFYNDMRRMEEMYGGEQDEHIQ